MHKYLSPKIIQWFIDYHFLKNGFQDNEKLKLFVPLDFYSQIIQEVYAVYSLDIETNELHIEKKYKFWLALLAEIYKKVGSKIYKFERSNGFLLDLDINKKNGHTLSMAEVENIKKIADSILKYNTKEIPNISQKCQEYINKKINSSLIDGILYLNDYGQLDL